MRALRKNIRIFGNNFEIFMLFACVCEFDLSDIKI